MTQKLYNLMNWPKIEEIIYSECDNPHEVLGPHKAGSQTLVQAYFPGAAEVSVVFEESGNTVQMELADEDGFFAALLPQREKTLPVYTYAVKDKEGRERVCGEAYRAEPQITANDMDKFKNGIHYTVYEKLGAHPMTIDGVRGVYFAEWSLKDGRIHQMRRLKDSGIFEIFVPDAKVGDNYKFEMKVKGGMTYLKADPYGNAAQLRPDTASVVADLDGFVWKEEK